MKAGFEEQGSVDRTWRLVPELLRRILRWFGFAVLALAAVYLAGANFILNTDYLNPVFFRKPEKLLVEWRSGWTLIPGFVHIEGLRIRGQSKKQQWQCRLEEGDIRLSLPPFAAKTVRVRRARGTGFEFYLRRRLTKETRDHPSARHAPEIEGFSNPPDPAPEDIYPPKKKKKRPWHIDVSDVRFDGPVDLWLGSFRILGQGLVGGDVDFRLRGPLHLPRAILDLEGGELSLGGETLAHDLHLGADVSLGPFRPREVKGTEVLNHLLGSFQLEDGEVPDLTTLNAFLPQAGSLRFASGTASFQMAFDKPSVEAGSSGTVAVSARDAGLLMAGREVAGDLDLRSKLLRGSLAEGYWEVAETTLELEKMRLAVAEAGAEGTVEGEETAEAVGGEVSEEDLWWGTLTIRHGKIDLGEPSDVDVETQFRLKDTRPLLQLFTARPAADGKEGKPPGWLKLLPNIKNVEGSASLDLDENGTVIDDVVVDGDQFDLMARFKMQEGQLDGQLWTRYRGFDLGIGLEDGKKRFKLIRPKRWYLSQPELDDTTSQVVPEEAPIQAPVENAGPSARPPAGR